MSDRSPEKTAHQPSYITTCLKKTLFTSKLKWSWVFACYFVYLSIGENDWFRVEPYLPTWAPKNAIVGVWHFDSLYSVASFDPEDFKRFRLELNSDQSFRIVGIPAAMVGYTEDEIDDAPGRSIKDYTGSPRKIWLLSSHPIDDQTVIEGEWSIVNGDFHDSKDEWIDLTAPGYNFEPWITVESGLFSRGTPSESDFRNDGVMLSPNHQWGRFHEEE